MQAMNKEKKKERKKLKQNVQIYAFIISNRKFIMTIDDSRIELFFFLYNPKENSKLNQQSNNNKFNTIHIHNTLLNHKMKNISKELKRREEKKQTTRIILRFYSVTITCNTKELKHKKN